MNPVLLVKKSRWIWIIVVDMSAICQIYLSLFSEHMVGLDFLDPLPQRRVMWLF